MNPRHQVLETCVLPTELRAFLFTFAAALPRQWTGTAFFTLQGWPGVLVGPGQSPGPRGETQPCDASQGYEIEGTKKYISKVNTLLAAQNL